MFQESQYINIISKISILTFFLLCSNTFAKNILFDISFSEFILKNASPLVSQIKEKKGLGYESIKKQISLSGCNPDLVLSTALLAENKAYLFHSKLIAALKDCTPRTTEKHTQQNIELLLQNKDPYLIIAGESLKSPMSYFGHSLLLFLDKDDFYFSPVISVLAPTEGLTTLEQITKGGFSSISAEVNILPLHQILDSYSNKESRKLKFIKLPKSDFNTKALIEFFDEKLPLTLDYNFFTKNCSTYLFDALEYACNCFGEKPKIVTPVFLEKKVQETTASTRFEINSLFYKFNENYNKLTHTDKSAVKDMFSNPDTNLAEDNKKLGNVAVLASRLSFESYRKPNDSYEKILDTYRKDDSLIKEIPLNSKAENKALDGLEISSAKIKLHKKSVNIKLSAVDFDHFEQRSKNFISSKLTAGAIEISNKKDTTKIESLDLLDIRAITPLNFVTRTPSWRLRIGADRTQSDDLQAISSMGIGAAFAFSNLTVYSMPSLELNSSLNFPIYSGIQLKSRFFSAKYETKNLENHSFSLYRRENNFIGYEYNMYKTKKNDTKHQIIFSYFF